MEGQDHLGGSLCQNYPNPFNSTTTIEYAMRVDGNELLDVSLKMYDLLGNEIRTIVNERKKSGYYVALWNGRDNSGKEVVSGVYLCKLRVGSMWKIKKVVLLR